jgi:hypothetical protein
MTTHHNRLCPRTLPVDAAEQWEKLVALATHRHRTNPWLIARIFALVMNEREAILSLTAHASQPKKEITPDDTEADLFDKENLISEEEVMGADDGDLGVFSWFACHPQESEDDVEYYSLIRRVLIPYEDASTDASRRCHHIGSIVSLYNYRILEAMIMRNAQEVHPVADVILYLHSLAPKNQKNIAESLGCRDLDDLMSRDWVQHLTVRGSTMLRVGIRCRLFMTSMIAECLFRELYESFVRSQRVLFIWPS